MVFKGVEVGSSYSCAASFYDYASFRQNGLNYTRSSWTRMAGWNGGVHSGADRGRVWVKLAIDVPWRTDPKTGASYSAPDSW